MGLKPLCEAGWKASTIADFPQPWNMAGLPGFHVGWGDGILLPTSSDFWVLFCFFLWIRGKFPRWNESHEGFWLLWEKVGDIFLLLFCRRHENGSLSSKPIISVMVSIRPKQIIPLLLGISNIPAIKSPHVLCTVWPT